MEVAYTCHLGCTAHDEKAKDTSISTASDLAAAERHNNHDYTEEDVRHLQSNIDLSLKHLNKQYDSNFMEVDYLNIVEITKKYYDEEFSEAVKKNNEEQIKKGHPERKIKDYFDKMSKNEKQEVAVEIMFQIGEAEDWEDKTIEEKQKAVSILLEQSKKIADIKGFRLVGISSHLNESSPHLHLVGICIDDRPLKTGLEKRINKSAVFTNKVLGDFIQTSLREETEKLFVKEFDWIDKFKEKEEGRNQDLTKNQIANRKLKEKNRQLEIQQEEFEQKAKQKQKEIEAIEKKKKLAEENLAAKEKLMDHYELFLKNQRIEMKENEEKINKQEEILNSNQVILDNQKSELDTVNNELSTVKAELERHRSLLDAIKTVYNYINPIELLKDAVMFLDRFKHELIEPVKAIKQKYKFNLTKNEEEHLAGFVKFLNTYSVDEKIEAIETIKDTFDDDVISVIEEDELEI